MQGCPKFKLRDGEEIECLTDHSRWPVTGPAIHHAPYGKVPESPKFGPQPAAGILFWNDAGEMLLGMESSLGETWKQARSEREEI